MLKCDNKAIHKAKVKRMEEIKRRIDLPLSENSKTVILQVEDLFREVDRKVEDFKKLTSIHCPDMCGICCARSKVSTTAIEMLPLALELWKNSEADLWLERIDDAKEAGLCVFFKEDPNAPGSGRCLAYGLRPLICRLFGFFTIKDKNGNYVYGSCKVIKEKYPETYQKAVNLIKEGAHPSNVTDYSIRIISMGTELSRKMIPINTAAKIALEKIGFEITKAKWQ